MGAGSLFEIRKRIEKYRRIRPSPTEDYKIGCILLEQPFFFNEQDWIPIPHDFSLTIVQGKTYNLQQGHGLRLWEEVLLRLTSMRHTYGEAEEVAEPEARYGEPVIVLPRLGQGSFRVIVTDAYDRRIYNLRPSSPPGKLLKEGFFLLRFP